MSNSTGPQVGDTATKVTSSEGGTIPVIVTVTRVIKSDSTPEFPYLVIFEYSYLLDGEGHGGEIMTRLNDQGADQHNYTTGHRRAEVVERTERPVRTEYVVLVDPMDDLQCDSCQ